MDEISDTTADKQQHEAVEAFLKQFDTPEAAISAIKSYAPERPLTPKASTNSNEAKGPVLLTVSDLRKKYKRGKQEIEVLRGINLEIHEGEFIAITGASGSGKSTLLQLMGGLDKPSAGTVLYGDTALSKLSDSKLSAFRRKTIGFVFQFFYLQPFLKVSRNLEVPAMFAQTPRGERVAKVNELAAAVGLSDRIDHFPKELSGGQMQRAAIARALVNQPKILLADEPTGNLDSTNSAAIIEVFQAVRKEFGTTIVIVTHDPAIAAQADREIVVKDGVLV